MSRERYQREKSLEESLARVHGALARTGQGAPAKGGTPVQPVRRSATALIGTGSFASVFIVLAFVTGQWWLLLPALVFAAAAGILLGQQLSGGGSTDVQELPQRERPKNPHIGMGADVASDAVLEPGVVVEMGATIGSGVTLREGAVVRMGATVEANAVIEARAVVSWGATVHKGAVVGNDAVVGAGSDIMAGARVPPNTSLMPGSTYRLTEGHGAPLPQASAKPQAEKAVDPRQARIDGVCDRLEAELRQAPEGVRAFLGTGSDTIAALRSTCHDLLRRERALREESSAESMARLDSEKAVLEARIARTTDELVRRSLQGAVGAIDEQKRQRELLQRNADRLDAEFTRLAWTLEGMSAQMVRLRSVSPQQGAPVDPEFEKSLQQLHHEIDAIADALEEVSSGSEGLSASQLPPIDESVSGRSAEEPQRADRPRQRDR